MSHFLSTVLSLLVVVGLFTILAKMFGGPSESCSIEAEVDPGDTVVTPVPSSRLILFARDHLLQNRY